MQFQIWIAQSDFVHFNFMTPNHRRGGFGQWPTTEDRLTDETMILRIAYIDGPDFETSSLLEK